MLRLSPRTWSVRPYLNPRKLSESAFQGKQNQKAPGLVRTKSCDWARQGLRYQYDPGYWRVRIDAGANVDAGAERRAGRTPLSAKLFVQLDSGRFEFEMP